MIERLFWFHLLVPILYSIQVYQEWQSLDTTEAVLISFVLFKIAVYMYFLALGWNTSPLMFFYNPCLEMSHCKGDPVVCLWFVCVPDMWTIMVISYGDGRESELCSPNCFGVQCCWLCDVAGLFGVVELALSGS